MIYKTFAQIQSKILRELDLETEDFISVDEFQDYVNDGIDVVESEIHKLGLEDEYFLTKSTIDLVQGTEEYTLPSDIYANKIRGIIYKNNNTIYTVKRLRTSSKFEDIEVINYYNTSTDFYRYILLNRTAAEGIKLQLIPDSRDTLVAGLRVWYIRNANRWITDDTAYCDLPEIAMQFLYAYLHFRCYDKENHPNLQEKKQDMINMRQLMLDTLSNMVPDGDSTMEMDLTHYQDME